jgi:uncharacterized protein with HEPN domain
VTEILLLDDVQRIAVIADQLAFLESALAHTSRERFRTDTVLQRSVLYALQTIAEAAAALPESVRKRAPALTWPTILAFRKPPAVLDIEEMWRIAAEEAPWLPQQLVAAGLVKRA